MVHREGQGVVPVVVPAQGPLKVGHDRQELVSRHLADGRDGEALSKECVDLIKPEALPLLDCLLGQKFSGIVDPFPLWVIVVPVVLCPNGQHDVFDIVRQLLPESLHLIAGLWKGLSEGCLIDVLAASIQKADGPDELKSLGSLEARAKTRKCSLILHYSISLIC